MQLTTTNEIKADKELCRNVNMGVMKNLIKGKMEKNKTFLELKISLEKVNSNKKVLI